jgi:hypothetical protein
MALDATHGVLMRQAMTMLWRKRRRLIAKSWILSRLYYPLRGARLLGRPNDEIWYSRTAPTCMRPLFGSAAAFNPVSSAENRSWSR